MLHFGLILFEADQDARCFPPRFHGSYELCPFRSSALLWHQVIDCFLLVIYSSEFFARFYVERRRYFCNAWNMVDFTTLAVGWPCFLFGSRLNLNVLRLFRCIRTIRAGRVFISVPELYLLVTGLSSSIKAMFFGSLLLVAALVFWAVIAVEVLHPITSRIPESTCERCQEGFAGIFAATVTLFQQVVVSDAWGEISLPLLQAKSWTAIVLFPIAVTISLGVMNLILAVIVERAAQGRDKDQERKIKQKEQNELLSRLLADGHSPVLSARAEVGSQGESLELQKQVQEADQELGRLLHRARELLDGVTSSFEDAAEEVQVPDGSQRDPNELQENQHRRLVEEQFESLCSHFEARAYEAEHLKQGCLQIQRRLQQVGSDVKEGRISLVVSEVL